MPTMKKRHCEGGTPEAICRSLLGSLFREIASLHSQWRWVEFIVYTLV